MTVAEANKVFAMLTAAWPRAVPSSSAEETAMIYCAALRDLELRNVLRGLEHLIRESKFLPTVAELRDATEALRPKLKSLPPPVVDQKTRDECSEFARQLSADFDRKMAELVDNAPTGPHGRFDVDGG